ncbi:hypothetical protein BAY61_17815 [Prauserella marina]|uniref:Uncharacterized protein n=1 Tax=Prauserella marina TaxID=530584 RepID=A0A222VRL0_9PSEU|nr:DUF2255 family protein [Prauserella marina]ASR36548.1 hypothetical protein BAY61_17815 [Prauserella marina]PWV73948.1 hypothetical protein DES30_108121 [Prauserella marina]SDD59579.1 hypothetical protein SAMN05421630_110121 [Prauserella marina]
MAAWTRDELGRIDESDEMEIAPTLGDGSLRKPVPVWVVRDGDELYVRAVNGPGAAWFRAATRRHEGHVEAGGVAKDVIFENVDGDTERIQDTLDAAYQAKYARYPSDIVGSVISGEARSATLKLVPR